MTQKLSKKARGIKYFVSALLLATLVTGYIAGTQAASNNTGSQSTPAPDWYYYYDAAPTPTDDRYYYYDATPTPTDDWYYYYDATPTPVDDWYYYDETPTPTDDLYYYNEDIILGDVNLDGIVNAIDFALMRKSLLGTAAPFTGNAATAADVNKDGKFNAIDFAKVRQFLLGLIKSFS